jgi:pimeloyl-ACP methyl ester carboxylesterase
VTDTASALPEGASERLELGSGSIHVQRGGEGPPLLFLHAAGGAGAWHPFLGLLARRFAVVALDHPGGGSDDLPEVEAMDDHVYHYLEVLDRLGLERVHVVGGSLGGWLAAELAVHSPERIERLALLGAAGLRVPGNMATDIFLMTPDQVVEASTPSGFPTRRCRSSRTAGTPCPSSRPRRSPTPSARSSSADRRARQMGVGDMPHYRTVKSMELFATQVRPALRGRASETREATPA